MGEAGVRRWGGRRWLAWLVPLVLSAALVALAATKVDIAAVGDALASVAAGWTAVAFLLMVSSFMARGESWFAAVRAAAPGAAVGRGVVRRGLFIGMATSTVAPARLGEGARAWVVARRIGRSRESFALVVGTVLSQTLVNVAALGILTAIALGGAHLAHTRGGSIAAALAVPLLLVGLLVAAPRALRRAQRSSHPRVARAGAWLLARLMELRQGFSMLRRRHTALHTIGVQLVAWSLQLATCYAVMLALHLRHGVGVPAAAAVLVAVNLTAIVPTTPANVGVFQATCIAVLARFGVAASRGLAYGIVLQAIEVVTALGLGLPALLREGLSWSELRSRT
jgi:phosphatidylinositol alpha-mannosyltransferase